jgi:signal transduction histidine kinase/CheY-like chemotaxis protein
MNKGIRTRALILVLVTLSIVLTVNTLILTWGFASHQKRSLENKTRLIGEHLREQIDRSINLGMPIEFLEGVNEYCRDIIDENKDIGYCMITDPSSRVLFHNDPLMAGRFLKDPVSQNISALTAGEVQKWTSDGVDYYDVPLPVKDTDGKLVGIIRLGLKYDTVTSQIYPLLWSSFAVALVTFLLASGFVTVFVSRKVVNPLVDMSSTAGLIAEGDLSRRLVIPRGQDEIVQLATSFNSMAESLEEREQRIQQGYRDLEKANKDLAESYRRLEGTAMELEQKSENLREKVGELSFLHQATDRLRESIELTDILQSAARDITESQGYDRVLFFLLDDEADTLEEKASLGFGDKPRPPVSWSLDSNNIFSVAVMEKSVHYVAQAALDSRVPDELISALDLREFAIIPMVGKDRCVGVIMVDNRRSVRPMRKDKLDILATFASTVAMAVENAYLYNQLVANLETVERANEELRRLDETKTNFLSLASHELRTPLVSVMGCLNLMLSKDLGAITNEQQRMLEIAVKGAIRLRDIIEDLLMVAKIEGGSMPIKFRWVSIEDIINSSIDEVTVMLEQRDIQFKTEALDLLPKLEADPERLHQCFTNLIGNAVKFTPDGGVVTVRGRKVKLDKNTRQVVPVTYDNSILSSDTLLELTVEDTGIGIKKENIEKIFEKFYEAGDVDSHSTGKVKFMGGGTGLGLSIVRGIVEGHHGRIWAESDGEDPVKCPGSRFITLLPIKQTSAKSPVESFELQSQAVAVSTHTTVRSGRKHKVLLIEDDDDIVTFTKLILEKKYRVMVSRDGFEGLKLAYAEKPDVILLDVWMRGIDGFEVCRILKGNKATSDIRVAMFTAAAQKHEIRRGMDAGADDYITKPFSPAELIQRIEALIDNRAEVT